MQAVIVEDLNGKRRVGTRIEGDHRLHQLLRNQGVAALPFEPNLQPGANRGYVQQHYGEGWLFDRNAGERGCPLILNVTNDCRFVHWAARVSRKTDDRAWTGSLRLVHSAESARSIGRGMNQLESVESLPNHRLDEAGGILLYGKNAFNPGVEGLLFTELYVNGSNLLVEWLAITQMNEDVKWNFDAPQSAV